MAAPAQPIREAAAEITQLATDVFEDATYAIAWLNEPNMATRDSAPIKLLEQTPNGFEIVKNVLLRIQYGVLT